MLTVKYTKKEMLLILAIFCFVVAGFKTLEIPIKHAEAMAIEKCGEIYEQSLTLNSDEILKLTEYHSKRADRGWEESKFFLRCIEE